MTNYYLDFFTLDFHCFDHEINPYGGPLTGRKHALCEPSDQARFAHPCIAYQDNFEEKFVVFHDLSQ